MLIIGDARLPEPVKKKLSAKGTFVPFSTQGLVYNALSGHPDIFFCQYGSFLAVAPNLPEKYIDLLTQYRVSFKKGKHPVGKNYPETAYYNAVISKQYFIHNPRLSDPVFRRFFQEKKTIAVKQGYVRCNTLPLKNNVYLTSDKGILKALQKVHAEVHYFSPKGILLEGFDHGFLGGCLGILENTVFITGNLVRYAEGKRLYALLKGLNYRVEELYNGPLIDGGGIFFLPENKKTGKPE